MDKKIPLAEICDLAVEMIKQNGCATMRVCGVSMQPMLYNQRDSVILGKPVFPLKKYDLPFYKMDDGRMIMHRVRKVNRDGTYDCCGDNAWVFERNIREDQIVGVVTSFIRKGKRIQVNKSFLYFIYTRTWPFLHCFKSYYRLIGKMKRTVRLLCLRLRPIHIQVSGGEQQMTDVILRPAGKNDIAQIQELAEQQGRLEIHKYQNQVLNEYWAKSEDAHQFFQKLRESGFLWVAVCEHEIIGYIGGNISAKRANNFSIGILRMIYLDEKYRHLGIGTEMVQQFKKYCKENQCRALSVSVLSQNEEAQKFYRKHGFIEHTATYMFFFE